jgi:hypothetical protein
MDQKFVNVTPHDVRVLLPDGSERVFPPSGIRAVVSATPTPRGEWDGIPLISTTWGQLEGLPEPAEGTLYIGSTLAAQAATREGRRDVVSPDSGPSAVRENGQIYAVRAFQTF